MKNKIWKEKLIKEMPFLSEQSLGTIKNLLEEQKKDIINQILSEAPEDRVVTEKAYVYKQIEADHFNQANSQWREILTKHLK